MNLHIFKKNVWLLPFLVFFSTYFLLHIRFTSHTFAMPTITGMQLTQATKILSNHRLHPEIIQTKEDKDLPSDTIIHQIPSAGRMIKENQTIYIILTQKPKQHTAPNLIGLSEQQIGQLANRFGLRVSCYNMPYTYMQNHCFAQWPSAGQIIKNRTVICYIAQQENALAIFPNIKGKTLTEVEAFVELYGMNLQTNIPPEKNRTYYVTHQQPAAGILINPNEAQNIVVYLTLSKKNK